MQKNYSKLLIVLLLLVSGYSFSQVTVETDTYTVEELVQDILIGNSCANTSNYSSLTGTDYGGASGIGYFEDPDGTFEFNEGVVLVSAGAASAGGPNGTYPGGNWPGDSDLDAIVSAIPGSSATSTNDATVIEFDFVPMTGSISFDFLFASEEYGSDSFECTYTDVFAFLLTDSDGNTTNLAVVPGTDIPVAVTTVHPDSNTVCGGANPDYFDTYFDAGTGPVNFNGITQVMTASSDVTPGETYHIKLAVANATDHALPSAVFLGAGTFSIGGDLGGDMTLANENPVCYGATADLSLLAGDGNSYQWTFNGMPIPGEVNSTYSATSSDFGGYGSGTYGVSAQIGGSEGCVIDDSVEIEFLENLPTDPILPYVICEDDVSDGFTEFDLTSKEYEITGGVDGYIFEYYTSEEDLENSVNEIAVPEAFTNTIPYEQEIFVRVGAYNCEYVRTFTLYVSKPNIGEPEPLEVCDEETLNDGFEAFDLNSTIDVILDGASSDDYIVLFFESEEAAITSDFNELISTPDSYVNTTAYEQTVYARLEDMTTGCYNTVGFDLIVHDLPEILTPTPLYGCDYAPTDGYVEFMLTEKNAEIVNGQSNISVSYFESEADYMSGESPLASAYTNIATPTQELFVVLRNVVTGCENFTTLQLVVSTPPVAVAPAPMEFCDPDNDGYGEFDIDAVASEVVPDDGDYIVTVHETQSDADTNVNAFESMYENIYPNDQTMYVRVEDAITGCYDVVPLELIVHPTPVVAVNLQPLEICDDSVADGLAEFDLSLQNEAVYGTQSTSEFSISYHATEDDAIADQSPLPTYYTNITPFLQTIYVRLETNATGCYTVREFDLIVHPNPVINPDYDNELALCDDFGEDGDETLVFDLTVENEEVTGGVDGYMVLYYETLADAQNNTNQIIPDTAYTNLENPQTIFVRVEDALTGCTSFTTVTLRVLNNPTPLAEIEAQEACDDDLDGDENNGQTVFNLTVDELTILNGETGVTATYYENYDDAFAGTNAIDNPESYYNVTPYNQTIYVAVTNNMTGCLTITEFELIVHPLPEVTEEPVYYLCEVDNDDVETIPLTDMDSFVLDGGDATGLVITYHATEAAAEAGTGEIVGPNITVEGTRDIAARVLDTITGCAQTLAYTIDIEQAPLAETPESYVLCESLTAEGYYNNDGIEVFDLSSLEATILAGQDPNGFTVSFYENYDDALAQLNAMPSEDVAAYESGSTIVYAVVTNDATGCTNGEPIEIELIVEPLPEITLYEKNEGIVCIDATNNPVIGMDLGTGYSYQWNTGATTPTIEVTQGGEYYVTVTNTNTENQCSYTSNTVVYEEASLPSVTPTVIQSEIFSGNNSVEVIAEGTGIASYTYQLDDNTPQDTGLFLGVIPGVHTVTIAEENGCGSLTIEVSVVDYMKYFTPNGDGVNDTWKIIGLENQENAQIFIFDRQGKLLKQMSATSEGWDGTYNGKILTSNDYWFKVVYTEPNTGQVKEYTDHFSMKK
ncbi:gliding motility-associated C-terminal domain-containing protein [Pustulibacterium marinum]|uniref:Gliding motility-associated C-terminal domain-containing protein n=1 Tax=Pustulibacterium marinum TaxID=1224947 RepID=A0A1I7F544_9FLAO|nr:choice-of-anchor L domain-containing protein [Pustulibacterium marinum]SFU31282.1 gliding motility-associated C-terminal domain-containing protein [Pustulibacterium marinum]